MNAAELIERAERKPAPSKSFASFAYPKDQGGSVLTKVRSLMEILVREKARPRGVDLVAAGKCPYGAIPPVACMFCAEGHILDCHAGQTCAEARCSHFLREIEEIGNGGINLERESVDPEDLLALERVAHRTPEASP